MQNGVYLKNEVVKVASRYKDSQKILHYEIGNEIAINNECLKIDKFYGRGNIRMTLPKCHVNISKGWIFTISINFMISEHCSHLETKRQILPGLYL